MPECASLASLRGLLAMDRCVRYQLGRVVVVVAGRQAPTFTRHAGWWRDLQLPAFSSLYSLTLLRPSSILHSSGRKWSCLPLAIFFFRRNQLSQLRDFKSYLLYFSFWVCKSSSQLWEVFFFFSKSFLNRFHSYRLCLFFCHFWHFLNCPYSNGNFDFFLSVLSSL